MNTTTTSHRIKSLPQLSDTLFLTDGGMETTLIYHHGIDLPHFASIALMKNVEGRKILREYYRDYLAIAREHRVGFILESPTWRASSDWAGPLGLTPDALVDLNRESIGLMHAIREEFEVPATPIVISGNVGPRGDGYQPSLALSADQAADYHFPQIRTLRDAGADFVSAFTISTVPEALGIVEAAAALEIPSVVSFTLETDGNLPTGQSLREAIEVVDAEASQAPVYYMINCAHPTHFAGIFANTGSWVGRLRGLRANASCRSHAELDASTELDPGDPGELGDQYWTLRESLPNLTILGGCCGTDLRHVRSIAQACHPTAAQLV